MIVSINKSVANGNAVAPPSKSMAHRYLICGAFSNSVSEISGIDFSEDVKATLDCLYKLGAFVDVKGDTVKIGGIDFKNLRENNLFCNESGSTLRFLIPICMMFNKKITLTGSERLFSRSLSVYSKIADEQGICFLQNENSVIVNGKLSSGKYIVRGDISSQFISGLMYVLPLLENDSSIELTGGLESMSYLDLTIKALKDFGVIIEKKDERTFYIKGNQSYKKNDCKVEGDYSNSAFFEAFNTVGGNVTVSGLASDSAQGDKVYLQYFQMLKSGTPTIDISDCPDLGPILIAVAVLNNGAVLKGTHRLKIKESDRGNAMKEELLKFGADITVEENEIVINKASLHSPTEKLSGHNDHRIVMALSVISSIYGGTIEQAESVKKSFPEFFSVLKTIGINLKVENNEVK